MNEEDKKLEPESWWDGIHEWLNFKTWIFIILFLLLAVLGIRIWQYYEQPILAVKTNTKNANISISYSEFDFQNTTVNGDGGIKTETKNYSSVNNLNIKIKPDNYYQIIVEKDGFYPYSQTIFAKKFGKYEINAKLIKPSLNNLENIVFTNTVISNDKKQIYFLNNASKDTNQNYLCSLDLADNSIKKLITDSWLGVEKIIYSPDKNRMLLKVKNYAYIFSGGQQKSDLKDSNKISTSWPRSVFYKSDIADQQIMTWSYDLTDKKYHYLGQYIQDVAWLNNNQIIYEYNTAPLPDQNVLNIVNNLNVADYTGQNWQTLIDLKNSELKLSKIIPSPQDKNQILLLPTPSNAQYDLKTKMYLFNINSKETKNLTEPIVFDASWSPDGSKILYEVLDNDNWNKPNLWVMDADGNNKIELGIKTLVSKTTWLDNSKILAALPINPDSKDIIKNDLAIPVKYYLEPQTATKDSIVLYDLGNKSIKNILEQLTKYIENVHDLSIRENIVYFLDKNNHLFNIPINQ